MPRSRRIAGTLNYQQSSSTLQMHAAAANAARGL
jgi:hypothetical protein